MFDKYNPLFASQDISFSGMKANRIAHRTYATNIANANSVDTGRFDQYGNMIPYKPQEVVFERVLSDHFNRHRVLGNVEGGVAVKKVVSLEGRYTKHWDPGSPAARLDGPDIGYVYTPEIRLSEQMANMKAADLAYHANAVAYNIGDKMFDLALTLGR
jgi:flagellar basal-body rod protein FlgC